MFVFDSRNVWMARLQTVPRRGSSRSGFGASMRLTPHGSIDRTQSEEGNSRDEARSPRIYSPMRAQAFADTKHAYDRASMVTCYITLVCVYGNFPIHFSSRVRVHPIASKSL